MIIEVAGIPRVGKTRVIERVQKSFPNLKVHPEVFKSLPFSDPTAFDYNEAYANICIERAENAWKSNGHNYFV